MMKTLKYATITSAWLTFLAFLAGCGGMGNGIKHDNQLPRDDVKTYEQMLKLKEKRIDMIPVTSSSIDTAEKAALAIYGKLHPGLKLSDMDPVDGIGEKEPTALDDYLGNMQNVLLKGNMSFSKDLAGSMMSLEDLLKNASKDEVKDILRKYKDNPGEISNRFSGGSFFADSDAFIAVPRANGIIPDMILKEYVKMLQEKVAGLKFSQSMEYTLKQKNRLPIKAEVYTVDGIDGIVRGLVTLYHNGYDFNPVFISNEEIKKSGVSPDKITNKLKDKAQGRYLAGLLATGAVMLYEPALGIPVAAGSLYLSNEYGLVTSADGLKVFSSPKVFSGADVKSMANSFDSNLRGIELGYAGYKLVSLTVYTAQKPADKVVWEPNGVYVQESDKLITAFFKEAAMAGAVAGLYKAGHNTAGGISYIKTGVSGGRGPGMPVVK